MSEAKKLLSNSTIMFAGTILGSIFSYLFNMLVGRWLGPVQYGEFSALMSLLMVLSVGGGTILTVVMRYSGELYSSEKFKSLKKFYFFFTKYVLILGIILFFLSLLFLRPISGFLSIDKNIPIVITLSNFVFGYMFSLNKGILQGTQRFTFASITNTLGMFFRFLIGILLIKLGLELSGAMLGVVLASGVAYVIAFGPIVKLMQKKQDNQKTENYRFDKKEIINYSWPTLIATVLLMIALNIDVIMVKHFFDPVDAGIYSAISTIAKIIFFLTAPIISVMFPMISEKKAKGDKHFKVFLFSLALTLLGALAILGVYYVAPGTVIKILYGKEYVAYYYLLPQVGFILVLYSLINIIVNYFMVVKNFVFLPIFAAVLVLQVLLIDYQHNNLEMVIKILISTLGLLFVLLLGYYLLTKKEQLKIYFRGKYEA